LNQTSLQSSEARLLLSQASGKVDEAESAYYSEEYKNATLLASSASRLIEEAVQAERMSQNQRWYATVAASGVVVAAVALATFILIRRRISRKT